MQEAKTKIEAHRCVRSQHTNPHGISARELLQYEYDDAPLLAHKQYYVSRSATPKDLAAPPDLQQEFNQLVNTWKQETAHFSLVKQQISSMSFLRIIALGKKALPLIFEEFGRMPASSWPVALEAITGENPGLDASNYRQAVQSWLKWGETHGYR